ncbi:SDR family oxidoreductase [Hyphobacterium marinum]|uniref:SDR family oxidoreductase n=1 Tax=Hyphobacterium marinum TaxID=3116574 RepID=A0ABU7M1L8_9PROT|nr:SDR family oxidoreductase [Hyphobacterium sp. Y6023]MEE2567422.1 SDR family oxidoreductase [Hyphobacterium sp. Y6023]
MTTKIALVTGAGKRLGAEIAKGLAADGHEVIVHFNTSADEADATVETIRASGGQARTAGFDLSDTGGIANFMDGLGRIDILVNSASVFEFDAPEHIDHDRMELALKVNLMAPALLASAMAKGHTGRSSGCVINLLDQKLFNLNPDFFSYTLSKAGLLAATETMAMAFAPRVRVNGIAPGITLPSAGQSQADFERAHRNNPMQGGAEPADIVRAVRFILATPSMTGETIAIDGGQHLDPRPHDVMFDGKDRS